MYKKFSRKTCIFSACNQIYSHLFWDSFSGTFIASITILFGCSTEYGTKHWLKAFFICLASALLQFLTAIFVFGWVWSIMWGIVFIKSKTTVRIIIIQFGYTCTWIHLYLQFSLSLQFLQIHYDMEVKEISIQLVYAESICPHIQLYSILYTFYSIFYILFNISFYYFLVDAQKCNIMLFISFKNIICYAIHDREHNLQH